MKENYRGYTIHIEQDTDAQSPAEWGNTDLFIVANHRDFFVQEPDEKSRSIDFDEINARHSHSHWIFPLIAYIHSGVALSLSRESYPFNCRWDSGQVGFIYVEKKQWRLSKSALKAAQAHVNEWNQYLSGDVCGYRIEDKDGDECESCWGFYGSKYCLAEAKSIVDAIVSHNRKERIERIKTFIRNRVPLEVRQLELC